MGKNGVDASRASYGRESGGSGVATWSAGRFVATNMETDSTSPCSRRRFAS